MHSSNTINTDFRTVVARGKKKNLIKKRKIRRLIFPPPFTIQTFKKKKKKNKRQLLRYKFIAYFPRGMDEIYFTEKVAARIFFLHSRWKSSRENERFCTKVSNVKFLFSRRNRQFFFFFFFSFPRTTGCQSTELFAPVSSAELDSRSRS